MDALHALEALVLSTLTSSQLPYSTGALGEAVHEFFHTLGLPEQYFESSPPSAIASHVHALLTAREMARSAGRPADVSLALEMERTAFFAARSLIHTALRGGGASRSRERPEWLSPANVLERYIETRFLAQGEETRPVLDPDSRVPPRTDARSTAPPAAGDGASPPTSSPVVRTAPYCWRLQCYRSRGVLDDGSHLRLYFLQAPEYDGPAPGPDEDRATELCDNTFLARIKPELLPAYTKVVREAHAQMHPAIHVEPWLRVPKGEDSDVRGPATGDRASETHGLLLMVAHRGGSTHSFFSGLPALYRWHGAYAVSKFVEVFRAHGTPIIVSTFYIRSLTPFGVPLVGVPSRLGPRSTLAAVPEGGPLPTPDEEAWAPPPTLLPSFVDRAAAEEPIRRSTTSTTRTLTTLLGAEEEAQYAPPTESSLSAPGLHAAAVCTAEGVCSLPKAGDRGFAPTPEDVPEYVRLLRERRSASLALDGGLPAPERIKELIRDVGLHFVLPRTSLSPLLTQGLLSAQEVAYAYAAWKFAFHTLPRSATEFTELGALVRGTTLGSTSSLAGVDLATSLSLLERLRKVVQTAAFTETTILDCIFRNAHVIAWLFDDLASFLKPRPYRSPGGSSAYTPNPVSAALLRAATGQAPPGRHVPSSFTFDEAPAGTRAHAAGPAGQERAPIDTRATTQLSMEEATAVLRRMCAGGATTSHADDVAILSAFLLFNRACTATNLWRTTGISALSFKLLPSKAPFLSADYTLPPQAIVLVVGAEFRGFLVRFSDVARGGVRLVASNSTQAWAASVTGLFREVMTLAATQQLKNKDIGEGGSKGIILLNPAHQSKGAVAFTKFVDSLLDLFVAPDIPVQSVPLLVMKRPRGSAVPMAPELLFLGPDEGTASFMGWASTHAKKRGYAFWKAISTGRPPHMGGMPHDSFAMTSTGIRSFEAGVQRKMGLGPWATNERSAVTKVQTGGPDGDLGSNEIKLSPPHESYIAIIDGSGTLCDLDGLDRGELLRLADARAPVEKYNRALLGPRGFLIDIHAKDVELPEAFAHALGGTSASVPLGIELRNIAHLLPFLRADAFIPCGGRPAAVDVANVETFLYGVTGPNAARLIETAITVRRNGRTTSGREQAPTSTTSTIPVGPAGAATPVRKYKYIVEGANSFFTPDARSYLDAQGVVVVKDASANKGGVTSSSLEVLAALTLNDEEYREHMTCAEGADVVAAVAAHRAWAEGGGPSPKATPGVPRFYAAYVVATQDVITANARAEFECLWSEASQAGTRPASLPLTSDLLSARITEMAAKFRDSEGLWAAAKFRAAILSSAIPPPLSSLLHGVGHVIERLPPAYVRALFASRAAASFVYATGMPSVEAAPELAFYEWVTAAEREGAVQGAPQGAHLAP